ncbi:hypothetical protein COO60DRAFT_693819 [Scenedesmus sp. NREL 46B-D3]|nr:hypothetical protein COO60DRAFT_693819 [Scenedesmus sp. NREL 46B-D3]
MTLHSFSQAGSSKQHCRGARACLPVSCSPAGSWLFRCTRRQCWPWHLQWSCLFSGVQMHPCSGCCYCCCRCRCCLQDKKAAEEARKKELAELFASAIKQPKVPAGVDPKSVVCEFFRHGRCDKGFKCKYSHDLSVERKTAKIDLFTDQRELGKEGEEGMEDWDQETLEKVVREKHGAEKPSNTTSIICKFFLDAVEKRQYGWFWKCPNGSDCKYKHALPPGYVLKSQMKELLEQERANAKDIAEVIEEERAQVDARTPITEQVFGAWHARKRADREAKRAAELEERKKKGLLNGREIFLSDNFVALDDANAGDDDEYRREDDDEARINDMHARRRKPHARQQGPRQRSSKRQQTVRAAAQQQPVEAPAAAVRQQRALRCSWMLQMLRCLMMMMTKIC